MWLGGNDESTYALFTKPESEWGLKRLVNPGDSAELAAPTMRCFVRCFGEHRLFASDTQGPSTGLIGLLVMSQNCQGGSRASTSGVPGLWVLVKTETDPGKVLPPKTHLNLSAPRVILGLAWGLSVQQRLYIPAVHSRTHRGFEHLDVQALVQIQSVNLSQGRSGIWDFSKLPR